MNARHAQCLRIALATLGLSCGASAFASQDLMSVDAKFRARIAKEKIRISAQERKSQEQGKSLDQSNCGSQSIGNLDTGNTGAAPREVFVFAPNAINIVGRGSCK